MTCMPASRRARATTLTPRSWPSRPSLASTTRIGPGGDMAERSWGRRRGCHHLMRRFGRRTARDVRSRTVPVSRRWRNVDGSGAARTMRRTDGPSHPPAERAMSSNEVRTTEGDGLGFGDGVRGFLGGIGFVLKTPSTWPYAAVPMVMAALLTCVLGALGVFGAWHVPESWVGEEGTWAATGRWLVTISAVVVALLAAVFVGLSLAQPLSGWALEKISLKQEEALTGSRSAEPSFLTSLWISIRVTL